MVSAYGESGNVFMEFFLHTTKKNTNLSNTDRVDVYAVIESRFQEVNHTRQTHKIREYETMDIHRSLPAAVAFHRHFGASR